MTARIEAVFPHPELITVRLVCPCCYTSLTAKVSMELSAAAVAEPPVKRRLQSPSRRGEPSQLPFALASTATASAPIAKRCRPHGELAEQEEEVEEEEEEEEKAETIRATSALLAPAPTLPDDDLQ